ncbi:MAG: LLM class flavin-dependent oxidoreductase, partial [Chitinophagaceae bacterium]
RVKEARLWSLPAILPKLFCAAISTETSGWCGSWADGLLTTSGSPEEIKEKADAFVANGGQGKPVSVQYSFSYAKNRKEALEAAHDQWRSNLVSREKLAEMYKTEQFDQQTNDITPEEVAEKLPMVTNMDQLFEEIDRISSAGVSLISLHNVNRNHEEFIDAFGSFKSKNHRTK